jgi:hypothetical protein
MIDADLFDQTNMDNTINNKDTHNDDKYSLMENNCSSQRISKTNHTRFDQTTQREKNCNYIILPFYILFYIGEWTILMYWLVEGLHIDKLLIIFIIINHELLLIDYCQLDIIIKQINTKNHLTLFTKINIFVWLYKLIAVQIYYTFHIIDNIHYLDNQLFKYVYMFHYVYVLLIPIVYIKYIIKLINAYIYKSYLISL